MASVPAIRADGAIAENPPIDGTARSAEPPLAWLAGYNRLPLLRQAGLLFGLAASIAVGVAIILWMQDSDWRPLEHRFATGDLEQVSSVLAGRGVDFRLDTQSGLVLVPAADLDAARLALAGAELIGGDTRGFELLDGEQGFGQSQFAESSRHQRALEGELARSIEKLNVVHEARVHLAVPRQSAFVGASRPPSAAVTLTLRPGNRLLPEQARAVMNLVAAAVPGLAAADVAVVDQRGALLSEQDRSLEDSQADWQYRYARNYERDLLAKVDNIVAAFVGERRFRAQVTAEMDFTWHEETAEQLDPDLPALRSEQVIEQRRTGGAAAEGVPGALSNQPPAAAQVPEVAAGAGSAAGPGGGESSSQESTRNYDFSRAISHTRKPQGTPQRLTVAVLLDDIASVDAQTGELVHEQWSEAELERLAALVRSAIGFEAARGDVVTVVNAPFVEEPVPEAAGSVPWDAPWVATLARQAAGLLGILLLALLVLRPALQRLATAPEPAMAEAVMLPGHEAAEAGPTALAERDIDETLDDVVSLTPGRTTAIANRGGYGAQLDAVRAMIAEDPARVAAVLKTWVINGE
jgi:flagellar M-ring protein FliF